MAPTAVLPQELFNAPTHGKSSPGPCLDLHSNNPVQAEPNPIIPLRSALTSEKTPLAIRFRALFSLKYYASDYPPTPYTLPAIHAIAAAFSSPSALLKHELAYCLGQTKNLDSVPFLRRVLEDRGEDPMCRHEAAEALGAVSDWDSLELLRSLRDDAWEVEVVRETCDIAVERIEWEHSADRKVERIRNR
jgi:deoxyhypusine monooxygenase